MSTGQHRKAPVSGIAPGCPPVDQLGVEQVCRADVSERRRHHAADVRMILLERIEELLHLVALEVRLRTAEIAGQNRELCPARVFGDERLRALDERTDRLETSVVRRVARGHCLELAG